MDRYDRMRDQMDRDQRFIDLVIRLIFAFVCTLVVIMLGGGVFVIYKLLAFFGVL